MTFSFFISGTPKAQPRVKAYRKGDRAGVYTPGTANEWKELVRIATNRATLPASAKSDAYTVKLVFILPRPAGHRNASGDLRKSAPLYPTSKPDLDNLEKAVLDVMVDCGALFDDSKIVNLSSSKEYQDDLAMRPGCLVTVEALT